MELKMEWKLEDGKKWVISQINIFTPTFISNIDRYSVDQLFLFVMYQFL